MTIIEAREAQPKDPKTVLADDARLNIAAHSRDVPDCRELGLMLGLMETVPDGSLTTTDPWYADPGDPEEAYRR